MTTIREAYDLARSHGGGTFDTITLDPIAPRDTWAVGGAKGIPSVVVPYGLNSLTRYAERTFEEVYLDLLAERVPCVGLWFDAGLLHIDAVDLIDDPVHARYAQAIRGELAIYNLGTHVTRRI